MGGDVDTSKRTVRLANDDLLSRSFLIWRLFDWVLRKQPDWRSLARDALSISMDIRRDE